MNKTVYFYRLTDATGVKRITIVDDPSDSGSILGEGSDGKIHQFDSYELYYAYEWAEKLGMKLESGKMDIFVPDSIFQNNG